VEFKTEHQKLDHTPTGKVTANEIEYARQDVACTLDLSNPAKQEFDLHPIERLSGHVKTGQRWPWQNRPTEMARD